MSPVLGAAPAQLRQLSGHLAAMADSLARPLARDERVRRHEIWSGPDATRFWDRLDRADDERRRLAARARQCAHDLRVHAAEQERASAASDLVGAGRHNRAVLLLDESGDGRVIERFGALEEAGRIAVIVPGMSSTLGRYRAEADPAAALLLTELERQDPITPTAVVHFLDYDPPNVSGWDMVRGLSSDRARHGAMRLDAFIDELRAAGVDPARITVIGHSYGSLLLGRALEERELAVGRGVAIGSPGLGAWVDDVADLRRPDVELFAACAPRDPICLAPVHGESPADRGFGATVFGVGAARGHSSYFEDESLANLARIVLGARPSA